MYKIYKVEDAIDVVYLANKFSTSAEELMDINGFDREYKFSSGDLVIVPNNNSVFQKYKVKTGDTIYSLSKKYQTDVNTLLKINGLEEDGYIYLDQELILPSENALIYVTKLGDSLSLVASNFKTSKENIVSANQNIILKEDQLIIYPKR